MAPVSAKMVTLKSSNGDIFKLSHGAAKFSNVLKSMLENRRSSDKGDSDDVIARLAVPSDPLRRVVQLMEYLRTKDAEDGVRRRRDSQPWARDPMGKVKKVFFDECGRIMIQEVIDCDQSALAQVAKELDIPVLKDIIVKTIVAESATQNHIHPHPELLDAPMNTSQCNS